MTHKTINELEALREKSINEMPEELRIRYSYIKQRLTCPIDAVKTQEVPYTQIQALMEAEKGNYKPLEDIQEELIRDSMRY